MNFTERDCKLGEFQAALIMKKLYSIDLRLTDNDPYVGSFNSPDFQQADGFYLEITHTRHPFICRTERTEHSCHVSPIIIEAQNRTKEQQALAFILERIMTKNLKHICCACDLFLFVTPIEMQSLCACEKRLRKQKATAYDLYFQAEISWTIFRKIYICEFSLTPLGAEYNVTNPHVEVLRRVGISKFRSFAGKREQTLCL